MPHRYGKVSGTSEESAAVSRGFGRKGMASQKSRGLNFGANGAPRNGMTTHEDSMSISATRPAELDLDASPSSESQQAESPLAPRSPVADAAWQPKLRPLDKKLAQCIGKQAVPAQPQTPTEYSRKVEAKGSEQCTAKPWTPSSRKSGSEALRAQLATPKGLQKEVPPAVWSELMRTRFAAEDPQQALARIQLESSCRIHIDRHQKQVRIFGSRECMQVAVQLLEELAADCIEEVVALDEDSLSNQRLQELDNLAAVHHVTLRAEDGQIIVLGQRSAVAEAIHALNKFLSSQEVHEQCHSDERPASSDLPVNVENCLSVLTSKFQGDFSAEPPRQLAEATREALLAEIAQSLHLARCQGSHLNTLGDAPWNQGRGEHVDVVAAWSVVRPDCAWTRQSWWDGLDLDGSSPVCTLLICHVTTPNTNAQSQEGHMVACRFSTLSESVVNSGDGAVQDAFAEKYSQQYYVIASLPHVRPVHVVSLTRTFSGPAKIAAWSVVSWHDVQPLQKTTSQWSLQTGR